MNEFLGSRAKLYSCLIDDGSEDKGKGTKNCVIKRKLEFEDCKNCLEAAKIENKINHQLKNEIDVNSRKKRS